VRDALAAAMKVNKYIKSVGVELEGGVPRPYTELLKLAEVLKLRGFYIGADMSVNVPPPEDFDDHWNSSAEIKFWVPFERLGDLAVFVIELWRMGFRQNETCGNHIHFIFKDHVFTVSLLFNARAVHIFQRLYHAYAKRKGEKYLARESNRYCKFYSKDMGKAAVEVANNACNSTRYRSVNFNSLYRHGTLEVRILPHADSPQEYIENLAWLIRAVNRVVDAMLSHVFEYSFDISSSFPELSPGRHVVMDEVV
jgi:hypothetical protein